MSNITVIIDGKNQQLLDFRDSFQYQFVSNQFQFTNCVPWHWHDAIEFVYVEKNDALFRFPQGDVTVPEGSVLLINSGVSHAAGALNSHRPVQYYNHLIASDQLAGAVGSHIRINFFDPVFSCHLLPFLLVAPSDVDHVKVQKLFKSASIAAQQQDFMYELTIHQNLTLIWMIFVKRTQDVWRNTTVKHDVRVDRIKCMLSFIQENYANRITLAQIAASAGISSRECSRCFQSILKITPFDYLTDCRLRKASDLLINTNMSIIEISYNSGFSTSSYFCRIFRKNTGCSPREFRQRLTETKRRTEE